MKYPSKKTLAKMDRKLRNLSGTLMVGPSSTPAERFRWDLCQNLVRYMHENDISQVKFAKLLGINQSRISEVVHHRIDKVSTDKLLAYNEKIFPKVEFKIAR
jgi:predicted XRE-type DNA-binding protein